MDKNAFVGLALVATLLFAAPHAAQQPKSKAELDAYTALYNEPVSYTHLTLPTILLV
mgnify:CR=1 FL=1